MPSDKRTERSHQTINRFSFRPIRGARVSDRLADAAKLKSDPGLFDFRDSTGDLEGLRDRVTP
jgi:hypothetical protein